MLLILNRCISTQKDKPFISKELKAILSIFSYTYYEIFLIMSIYNF
uniref:Uncharacterized protein n=1 Tax=Osmundaria fimbriata TaxID=228265 RepID=A0A1Z1M599_OSMFI|nr:hypothetical protein [Osmundaria fimbriata]ARW60944.1 hypothetical protein [Osmundaria fimbriata]